MLSTKTQFAGTSIHKTIIQIFHYLIKKNYFEEFNLLDDGDYWETNNEDLLEQKFRINAGLIDDFSIAVESIPKNSDENFDEYFKRIIQKIEKRNFK
ncbi:MAG: hypothetical protein K9H26_12755 [Prolixibacteraceae bacterium]|nr:hypothetical protein [Prolixibacteraceae bacterium]